MLDIAWQELFLIGVVALIVIGPKDLPKALYSVGQWVKKLRHMSRDLQNNFDDLMREAELSDIKEKAEAVRRLNINSEIEKAIDPGGSLRTEFQPPSDAELLGDLTAARSDPPPAELPTPEPAAEPPAEPATASDREREEVTTAAPARAAEKSLT